MATPDKPLEQMTAQERFELGRSRYKEGSFDEAINVWLEIHRKDDRKAYAKAQFNLGTAYKNQDKLEQAIKTWSNITRDDNPETYAQAQLNLGNVYKDQGEVDKAITTWSNITRDDNNHKAYAKAQFNLGLTYRTQEKMDDAIAAWIKVNPNDDPKTYAWAQYSLGAAYKKQGQWSRAIDAWLKVRHNDDPRAYARAQFSLGVAYYKGKPGEAIKVWSEVRYDDDPDAYARAQFKLGEFYEDKGENKQAKEAYRNAREFHYYKSERNYRILECPQEIIKKLRDIAINTDKVREALQIIPEFESKVAHYSRASTAFNLFGDEKNNKNPSIFRLSTIRGVNDPKEGLVLRDYWEQQGISENIHTSGTATFISCFTFNHDSLNQFRLYGKENGREATGVSLVFKKEFFNEDPGVLKHIVGASSGPFNKSGEIESDEADKLESDNKKQLISKSALYRCIYLDPKTGYWTLAQRDKSTFYREHNEDADTQEKWEKYYDKLIPEKEKNIEKYLFGEEDNKNKSISSILKSIFTEAHLYNECNKDEQQKILEAIRFILLPLQYLVKHIAFQEEQECRIMYITHLHDEKIRHDWERQWMYVEYEEPVLPHIDKIYLSPGAAKYQDFFRILLDQKEDGKESKVRISQNPFRNKE